MAARILLIDDEKSIRVTLEHFLTEKGHEVTTAGNYPEAVDSINRLNFDLIIADILLGSMTGIDLLREISRRNLTCPVIMITGAPDIRTATDALRLGAFDYLSKPIKKEQVIHLTDMALRHKSLQDEKEKYRMHLQTIFTNINEGILTVDEQGTVTEINEAACKICEYSRDIIGRAYESVPAPCSRKCAEMLNNTLRNRKPVEMFRFECRQNSHPGKVVTINASPLIENNGKLSGAMLVVRDETRLEDLERDLGERKQYHNIIGKSRKMQRIYNLMDTLADVPSTVLITGESGTGKELAAEALHYKGSRRKKPLVKVHCSALQENLLESELFGHIQGAFTGAVKSKVGRFHKADGGTIFLDEIGDISKTIQLKLLRVLQEREFERVGESTPCKVDVRVVTATNQDLRKKVRAGEFREDLYYRLHVVEIEMPSLRDNKEDIPLLIDHFLHKFNKLFAREIAGLSNEAMNLCMNYPWPGNVRELEHTLEHAFVHCHQNIISIDHLPPDITKSTGTDILFIKQNKGDSSQAILQALEKCGWNKSRAARILGMSRPTMYRKIKEMKAGDKSDLKL